LQPFRPPVPEAVVVAGPAGPLEARAEDPAPAAAPRVVGVVCHPHPLYGGTMQNKVVHTLARAMQELGAPTLRFNFRGVGASGGTHDAGVGEIEDAMAAAQWARRRWGCDRLWLAGFSFGATVALQAAPRLEPERLVTVAPPVARLGLAQRPRRPDAAWLVVQGDADELVDAAEVARWAAAYEPPPQLRLLAGAEHFFHGRLAELRETVMSFLGDPLRSAGAGQPGG
jgi:alpha/beta superfamily hydrolase